MSTTARLGVDIVGTDKTGVAFASAHRNLRTAQAEMRKFGAVSNTAFNTFSAGISRAGVALGAAFSVTAMARFAQTAIKSLADIKDNAERAGLAISDMQSLTFAARQGGGSADDIVTIFQKFNMELNKAQGGTGKLGELLAANNIKLVDGNGKAREAKDLFYDILDLIKNSANAIDRGAIAQIAFGKSAQDALPYLLEGADAIRAQEQAARDVGAVMDEEIIKKAALFEDGWTAAWDGWTAQAMASMYEVSKFLKEFGAQADANMHKVGQLYGIEPPTAAGASQTVNRDGKGNVGGKFTVMHKSGSDDDDANEKALKHLESERQAVVDLIAALDHENRIVAFNSTQQAIANNLRTGGTIATAAQREEIIRLTMSMSAAEIAQKKLKEAQEEHEATIREVGDIIRNEFMGAFDAIASGTESVSKAFETMTLDILQSISRMLMDKAMQQMIDMGFNALMNFGNAGVAPSQQSGGFGGFFAGGGNLGAGKWGIAGENGPEVIQGPANVVPMTGGGYRKVEIHNYGSKVESRERDTGNGQRDLIIMVDQRIARQMADPYSGSSPALAARGARAPMKRR